MIDLILNVFKLDIVIFVDVFLEIVLILNCFVGVIFNNFKGNFVNVIRKFFFLVILVSFVWFCFIKKVVGK